MPSDPALFLPKLYTPKKILLLNDKIGILPHISNYKYYKNKNLNLEKYYLINPTDKFTNVLDYIFSCKYIISSSLHGLICADAYNIPNIWLDEYELSEGDFKFKDYFLSQKREYIKINNLNDFNEQILYSKGNTINLEKLLSSFIF